MSFDPPIFINVRDRVTHLRSLVSWLERAGHQHITLIDNASTYEPCVEYLKSTPHDVVCLGANLGARALWDANLAPAGWFVYSDPDVVPIEACPLDAVQHLRDLMDRNAVWPKAGLGLYLADVPEDLPSLHHERALIAEGRRVPGGAYASQIDTTFALYRPGQYASFSYAGLRASYPHTARHMSWYVTEPDEEDRYYLDHALGGPMHSSWATAHGRPCR